MTQEEKQLLLKDLSARLPYGVKLNFYSQAINENMVCTLLGIEPDDDKPIIAKTDKGCFCFTQDHIKPYLRSMDSMTDEEKVMYSNYQIIVRRLGLMFEYNIASTIEWLLERHFDYQGLIEKGLAIEAKEGIYN